MSNLQTFTNNNQAQNPISGAFGNGNIQFFTATTSWTVPAGITRVRARVWGGGGSGGFRGSLFTAGSGAGGGFAMKVITVTPGASITITVGSGGVRRTTDTNGAAGGTSSFGASVSATGGAGGDSSFSAAAAGGTGSGGDINTTGGAGGTAAGLGAGGAASLLGNGGSDFGDNTSISAGISGYGGSYVRYPPAGFTGMPGYNPSIGSTGTTFPLSATNTNFLSIDLIGTGSGGMFRVGSSTNEYAGSGCNGGGGAGGGTSSFNGQGGDGGFPGGGGGSAFGLTPSGAGAMGLVIVEW